VIGMSDYYLNDANFVAYPVERQAPLLTAFGVDVGPFMPGKRSDKKFMPSFSPSYSAQRCF